MGNNRLREPEIVIDPQRKRQALAQIEEAVGRKEIISGPSLWGLTRIQLQYISIGYWAGQGIFAAFMLLFFHNMRVTDADITEYLAWFSAASALLGVTGVTELGKHFACNTAELEQSCYLNLQQLWTIKMIFFGAVDILALLLIMMGISCQTGSGFLVTGIYLLVPFVLSNLCYLAIATASRGGGERYRQYALAAVLGLAAAIPSTAPGAYHIRYLWIWGLVLAVGCVLLAAELKKVYGRFAKGDIICWN